MSCYSRVTTGLAPYLVFGDTPRLRRHSYHLDLVLPWFTFRLFDDLYERYFEVLLTEPTPCCGARFVLRLASVGPGDWESHRSCDECGLHEATVERSVQMLRDFEDGSLSDFRLASFGTLPTLFQVKVSPLVSSLAWPPLEKWLTSNLEELARWLFDPARGENNFVPAIFAAAVREWEFSPLPVELVEVFS